MIFIVYSILALSLVNPLDPLIIRSCSFGTRLTMETSNQPVSPVMNVSDPALSPTVREDPPSPSVLETNRSQLPHNTYGAYNTVNVNPVNELWNIFWSEKSHRKQFFKTVDNLSKVKKSLSKVWFLTQCYKNNVIPKTMRTNTSPSDRFTEEGRRDWFKVQHERSRELVRVAVIEEKINLLSLRENLNISEKLLIQLGNGDVYLQGAIAERLEVRGRALLKQHNNTHNQKLRSLLTEYGQIIPPDLSKSGLSSINLSQLTTSSSNNRHFTKRSKRKRQNRRIARNVPQLWTNFSGSTLTEGEQRLLNKGLNFCPLRRRVNRTEAEVAFQRYSRSCRWKEFWASRALAPIEEEEEEEGEGEPVKSIFKDSTIKTNFPRKHPCPPQASRALECSPCRYHGR